MPLVCGIGIRREWTHNDFSTATDMSSNTPSPRIRHDYLLLHKPLISALTALEAFATPEGVEAYRRFPNLVSKARTLLPDLQQLIETMPPEFVEARVRMALDGVPLIAPVDHDIPTGLMGD